MKGYYIGLGIRYLVILVAAGAIGCDLDSFTPEEEATIEKATTSGRESADARYQTGARTIAGKLFARHSAEGENRAPRIDPFSCLFGLAITPVIENARKLEQEMAEIRAKDAAQKRRRQRVQLIIEDWRLTREYGFVTVSGQVTNNTSMPLENIMAVATFYASNGGFVKTSDALISYNPILSGQTSPFEVIVSDNPAIRTALVDFQVLFGGTVPSMTRKQFDAPTAADLAAQRKRDERTQRIIAEAVRSRKEREARQREEEAHKAEAARWRTWNDKSAGYSIDAKFLSAAGGNVKLQTRDGEIMTIAIDRLSRADRDWIDARRKAALRRP